MCILHSAGGNSPCITSVSLQGAKCFDYNESLQLMVTGGCDRAVRLWTRFVTTHPVAALLGHSTAVLDVAIYQPAGQIFSYSRDAVSHKVTSNEIHISHCEFSK